MIEHRAKAPTPQQRLGIHTFTSGSLEKAALRASALGANTFQIFSASPRMWRARAPDPVQVTLLKAARERFDLRPLAIHVNYLINLASLDAAVRAKQIAAFRGELDRRRGARSQRAPIPLPAPEPIPSPQSPIPILNYSGGLPRPNGTTASAPPCSPGDCLRVSPCLAPMEP